MQLKTELLQLKGVGDKIQERLTSAGLNTVEDLIDYYPKRYDDYSVITPIKNIDIGKVSLKVKLSQIGSRRTRRGLSLTEAVAEDDTGKVKIVWFNQPYRAKSINPSKQYLLSGEYAFQSGRLQIVNPNIELDEEVDHVQTGRIVPIYTERGQLNSVILRKLVKQIQPLMQSLPETLPRWLIDKYNLISYGAACANIHLPQSIELLEQARKRLGFEELFVLMMASSQIHIQSLRAKALPVAFSQDVATEFVKNLPFKMTDAQRKCVWQIYKDIDSDEPMNRLIEGDVGSGKTVVAAMASLMVAHAGLQVALLAPTELLARQHADTLAKLLAHSPLKNKIGLLTGSLKSAPKKLILDKLKNNHLSIVVGTHALLQESVDWHKLGMIIVDEQHRFGVGQRQKLVLKAGHMPHVLCLTATPIPRSLALTVYGDLDIGILDQVPSQKAGVDTEIVSPNSFAQMFKIIEAELKAGRQAYVVCPLISESEALQATSAEKLYAELSARELKNWKVGLLHGRLKADQKDEVMQKFIKHQLDVIVSTTVIEVGVDVANATVMAIYSADRFGLAQLHQLRGRVGRAEHRGKCFLVMSDSSAPSRRILAISQTNDGFKLAEMDLKLRGPGAIYGTRQHGVLDLRIAELTDTKLIAECRAAVKDFAQNNENLLKYPQIAAKVAKASKLTYLN